MARKLELIETVRAQLTLELNGPPQKARCGLEPLQERFIFEIAGPRAETSAELRPRPGKGLDSAHNGTSRRDRD